jgi:hypothetical protein
MPRHESISDEEILDRALPLTARAGPAGFKLADLARKLGVAPRRRCCNALVTSKPSSSERLPQTTSASCYGSRASRRT